MKRMYIRNLKYLHVKLVLWILNNHLEFTTHTQPVLILNFTKNQIKYSKLI